METTTLIIGNTKYLSTPSLTFGDYGGSGSVGLANIEELEKLAGEENTFHTWEHLHYDDGTGTYTPLHDDTDLHLQVNDEPPKVIVMEGGYSSKTAYVLADWEEGMETFNALSDYPCINDEAVSLVELRWEDEALESYLLDDLNRTLPEGLKEVADGLNNTDPLVAAYRAAMESTNTYPEPEYNGVHVDIDRIKDAYRAHVAKWFRQTITPKLTSTYTRLSKRLSVLLKQGELFHVDHSRLASFYAARR